MDPKIKIEILVKISITLDNNNYENDLTQNNILTWKRQLIQNDI